MDSRKDTGREGEDIACRFLMEKGHTILERNWRCGHLETDIISLDEEGLHFTEVKTRRPPMQADPQENVGFKKQHNLAAAANAYLAKKDDGQLGVYECFFDVVAIVLEEKKTTIEYFPKAFIPIYV